MEIQRTRLTQRTHGDPKVSNTRRRKTKSLTKPLHHTVYCADVGNISSL